MERDELEQIVRAIPLAIAEVNELYPQWLADHEREVERMRAEYGVRDDAAEENRFEAEQQVIDRIMNEGEPEGAA